VSIAAQDSPTETAETADPGVFRLVDYASGADSAGSVPVTGPPGVIAARVNGAPIFMADVLSPYATQLEGFRKNHGESQLRQAQVMLVRRDLPQYIETAVLVDKVLSTLDADQKAGVQKQLDEIFDQQLADMMKQVGVTSIAELEAKITAAGSTLANELQVTGNTLPEVREAFGRKALSTQYLREAIGADPEVSRTQLLEEYHASLADYSTPEKVKWQQIRISYERHGGQDGARRVLAQALGELHGGAPFDDLARKYSDEFLATKGGHWDWTQPESLSDAQLRDVLLATGVDQVADPIMGEKAFLIVRVTGKQAAATKPFSEVQVELREKILKREREARIAEVLEEAKSQAVIETMFDELESTGERQDPPVAGAGTAASR
jgi:parvulin-like peptidyl-prolyl isomerase